MIARAATAQHAPDGPEEAAQNNKDRNEGRE